MRYEHPPAIGQGIEQVHGSIQANGQPDIDRVSNRFQRFWRIFNILTSIPSERGQAMGMGPILDTTAAYLSLDQFKDVGLTVERWNQSLIIRLPGAGELKDAKPRLISGHLDTVEDGTGIVPVLEPDGTIHPEGETILGSDDKAAVATAMAVIEEFALSGESHIPLEMVLTSDEESTTEQSGLLPFNELHSTLALVLDLAEEPGGVINGAYGYTGFEAHIEGIRSEVAPQFLPELMQIVGGNLVGFPSRRITELATLPIGVDANVEITGISFGKGRNTVPGKGEIKGSISFISFARAEEILKVLEQNAQRYGAKLVTEKGNGRWTFVLTFEGLSGHPSLDEGVYPVLPDMTDTVAAISGQTTGRELETNRRARVNVGTFALHREAAHSMALDMEGEVRYPVVGDENLIIGHLQALVERYGGSFKSQIENWPYVLPDDAEVLQLLFSILKKHDIVPRMRVSKSMSDASGMNGQETQGGILQVVVTSEGTIDAHSHNERNHRNSINTIGKIIYDWMTVQK